MLVPVSSHLQFSQTGSNLTVVISGLRANDTSNKKAFTFTHKKGVHLNTYTIKEFDNKDDELAAEQQVTADGYTSALRLVKNVSSDTERIVVFDQDGAKVGGTLVSFWKKNYRRR